MSALNSLKLVSIKKPMHQPVIVIRRNKLSTHIWEQIQLAKGQISGTPFVLMKFRSIKDAHTGLRKQVEVPKRIKPWWFQTEEGKVCVSIRYGACTIELAKGKPSIQVDSAEDLIKALETVKVAVEAGDLDPQIELASSILGSGFKK